MKRSVVAGPDLWVCKGVTAVIREKHPLKVIAEVQDCRALQEAVRRTQLDLIVLQPGFERGSFLNLVGDLRDLTDAVVIVICKRPHLGYVGPCVKLGVAGLVLDTDPNIHLSQAVVEGSPRTPYLSPSVAVALARNPHELFRLSHMELETVRLLALGRKICEIARDLDLRASSVCTYRERAMRKLDLHSVAELTDYLASLGPELAVLTENKAGATNRPRRNGRPPARQSKKPVKRRSRR